MTGLSKKKIYQQRLRGSGDDLTVLCKSCESWKPASSYDKSGVLYKSICKECHRQKYGPGSGYKSPSELRRQKASAEKRERFLSEIVHCVNCGEGKPRSEYYIAKGNRYSDKCCSSRRTIEQVRNDLAEGMKSCTVCRLRLPLSDFPVGGGGKDGVRGSCKCCTAARMKFHSERKDRVSAIQATADGSATILSISRMLRQANHCDYCGVEMGQHYPVRPSNKTIDHKTPLSRGGKHTLDNITVMCLGCNSSKGNRTMSEFARVKKKAVRQ